MAEGAVDVARLFDSVQAKARDADFSLRQAAMEIGIDPSLLIRLRGGHSPDLVAYSAMVRWIGTSADEFLLKTAPRGEEPSGSGDLEADLMAFLAVRDDLGPDEKVYLLDVFAASARLVLSRRVDDAGDRSPH